MSASIGPPQTPSPRPNRREILRGLLTVPLLGDPHLEPLSAFASEEEPKAAPKRLIEFGWDEPDTAFLRRHIRAMEATPFDGCVFRAHAHPSEGPPLNFTWLGWGRRAFTDGELQAALDDLRATDLGRFRHGFLRFNTTPADLDWFDDFDAIRQNARLAARLAAVANGCRGLLFDTEQYEGRLFDYAAQRDRATKSWEVYADQTRRRGFEVMDAFQEGFPEDLTVLLTFGHSYPWRQSEGGRRPLAECPYGLLAPFLDGMIAAARGGTRLIDGHELSYGYREPERFAEARRTINEDVLPIVADPEAYRRVVSAGFGLWMDYDWRKHGWHIDDVSKNYFTPETFERSVRSALNSADEFVWIYTEQPRWWTEAGGPEKLPEAYAEALRRAGNSGIAG